MDSPAIAKQLGAHKNYRGKMRFHVIPTTPSSQGYYRGDCGRILTSGDNSEIHEWPGAAGVKLDLVICDKCWVELDPKDWTLLRQCGCMPAYQKFNRPLAWKQSPLSKKPPQIKIQPLICPHCQRGELVQEEESIVGHTERGFRRQLIYRCNNSDCGVLVQTFKDTKRA